jgi:hypothetical protein
MKWPWVSRERFEDAKEAIARLQAENKELREILIPQLREAPVPLALTENTDFSKVQPIPGKPTLAVVMGEANKAAFERARTPGARSITEDLAEARERMTRIKREVNGN